MDIETGLQLVYVGLAANVSDEEDVSLSVLKLYIRLTFRDSDDELPNAGQMHYSPHPRISNKALGIQTNRSNIEFFFPNT